MYILPRSLTLVSLFLFLFCHNANSQDSTKWAIGIHGGPAAVTLYGDGAGVAVRPGYLSGIGFKFSFDRMFSLCAELNFESKGYNKKYTDIEFHYAFNYITLPLTLRYTLSSKKIKYYFQAGPYFGYLVDVRTRTVYEGNSKIEHKENLDNYEKNDIGITAGLGTIIPLSKKFQLPIEARGNFGLHQLYSNERYEDSEIKNESFALILGIQYVF